jgi:uncharacterized membrane protein
MADARLRSAKRPIAIVRRPLSSLLLPIPVVCFLGAMLTDLSYMNSGGNLTWVNFSSWLLAAGLAFGAFAGLVLLIDAIRGAASWIQFGLLVVTFVVEFINSLVHARDGWTAVVPLGLTLSIVGAILILLTGWLVQSVRYRMAGEAV